MIAIGRHALLLRSPKKIMSMDFYLSVVGVATFAAGWTAYAAMLQPLFESRLSRCAHAW